MTILYTDAQNFTAAQTTGTAAAGYEETNLTGERAERIEYAWVNGATTAAVLTLTLDTAVDLAGVLLTEVTASTVTVEWSPAAVSYTAIVTAQAPTTRAYGRGRISASVDATLAKYVRITFASHTSAQGLGAVYLWGSRTDYTRAPAWDMQIQHLMPRAAIRLANGRLVAARIGSPYEIWSLSWYELSTLTENPMAIKTAAEAGTIGLDLEYDEHVIPAMLASDESLATLSDSGLTQYGFSLQEVI